MCIRDRVTGAEELSVVELVTGAEELSVVELDGVGTGVVVFLVHVLDVVVFFFVHGVVS